MSEGKTLKEIAEGLGTSVEEVRRLALRMGIEPAADSTCLCSPLLETVTSSIRQALVETNLVEQIVGSSVPPSGIESVFEKRSAELLALPGVRGVGLGTDAKGRRFIRVYCEVKPEGATTIPRVVDGYAVLVRQCGRVVARSDESA